MRCACEMVMGLGSHDALPGRATSAQLTRDISTNSLRPFFSHSSPAFRTLWSLLHFTKMRRKQSARGPAGEERVALAAFETGRPEAEALLVVERRGPAPYHQISTRSWGDQRRLPPLCDADKPCPRHLKGLRPWFRKVEKPLVRSSFSTCPPNNLRVCVSAA